MKRRPASLLVAVLILVLSAGAAFAARPTGGPSTAHAGPAVHAPAATVSPTPRPTERPEASESESDAADEAESADSAHPDNHGALVSQAARATTPAGCANHGQYVSLVARGAYVPGVTTLPAGTSPCSLATSHPATTDEPSGGSGGQGQNQGKGKGQAKAHGRPSQAPR